MAYIQDQQLKLSANNSLVDIIEQIGKKAVSMGFLRIEIVKSQILNTNIMWTQLLLYDNEALPIKLDILKDIYTDATKNIYSSPGSGLNTEGNFITPKSNNIAIFLANKGYIFIGITPREDAAPSVFNFGLFKDWGLTKHTADFIKIIKLFQNISNLSYDILGHSAGALVALNYSSSSNIINGLQSVRIIDIVGRYPDPSQDLTNAQISYNATNQLISRGTFTDTEILGFKMLVQNAQTNPIGDSGVPRPTGGNFTNEALLFFSLINTNQLPGVLTNITGLPSDWYFKQGFLSGTYIFGPSPTTDKYSLTHTKIQTIYDAISSLGSGIYPQAYDRDFFAVWSGNFPLRFENIRVPVYYINTELGFGDVNFTISLINTIVIYDVIKDYGHADPVYSETAERDFWTKLFR